MFLSPVQVLYIKLASVSGALAVGLGAFGAHGLQSRITDQKRIKNWETAAHYHLIHSAVMVGAMLAARRNHHMIGSLFLGGMSFFSGSLYALVLTDKKKLGMITPIGGLGLIGGWIALALAL